GFYLCPTTYSLPRRWTLHCKHSPQDLNAEDRNGYSDPISGERFQMLVCKRNLNPVYEPKDAKFDFPIYTSLMHKLGTLEFIVWDVDRIRNAYLGECAFPVYQWFNGTAFAFDGPNNEVRHFQLPRIRVEILTPLLLTPTPLASFLTPYYTGNRAWDYAHQSPVRPPSRHDEPARLWENIRHIGCNSNHVGIVVLEICGAKDLPKWPNTHMGWDMDPFVEASIGNKLYFHMRECDLSLHVRLTVFNWDRCTFNNYVSEAEVNVTTFVERATKKDPNTAPANHA
ncbi:hypothetical protein BJY52DRAFT_1384684, partial [Lactarius psammicola]